MGFGAAAFVGAIADLESSPEAARAGFLALAADRLGAEAEVSFGLREVVAFDAFAPEALVVAFKQMV